MTDTIKQLESDIAAIRSTIEKLDLRLYALKPDPYAEAKAAYADGELEVLNDGVWSSICNTLPIAFGKPPERYRRKPGLPDWVSNKGNCYVIMTNGVISTAHSIEYKKECWLIGNLFQTEAEAITKRDQMLAQAKAEREGTVREWYLNRDARTGGLNASLCGSELIIAENIHVREVIKPEVSDV